MRTAVRENRQVEGASKEGLRLPGAGKAGSVFIMKVSVILVFSEHWLNLTIPHTIC